MTEPKPKQTRTYVVLTQNPEQSAGFTKLATVEAVSAEVACVAALETAGLPENVKVAVAVPVGNWNACKVREETRPRFEAKRMSAMPEKEPEANGEPERPDIDQSDAAGLT